MNRKSKREMKFAKKREMVFAKEHALKFAILDYTKEDAISYMNTHNHVRRLLRWRDMKIEFYI